MQIIKFVNKSRCSEISHPRKNPKITILFKQKNFVLGLRVNFIEMTLPRLVFISFTTNEKNYSKLTKLIDMIV